MKKHQKNRIVCVIMAFVFVFTLALAGCDLFSTDDGKSGSSGGSSSGSTSSSKTTCTSCKGSGYCKWCKGLGKVGGKTCTWCHGNGICSFCKGKGYKNINMISQQPVAMRAIRAF